MKSRRFLVVCLALMAGLFLAVALVEPPASLANGPPPAGTPQVVKVSHPLSLDLDAQSASRPLRAVKMHLDWPGVLSPSVRPAILTSSRNGTGWQKIMAEDFEGTFPPPGWVLTDTSSTEGGEYFWGKRDCKALSGSYSVWAGGGGSDGQLLQCGATYANNLYTWLIYGPVDLSQAADAELQLALWTDLEGYGAVFVDEVGWLASTDGETLAMVFVSAISSSSSVGQIFLSL